MGNLKKALKAITLLMYRDDSGSKLNQPFLRRLVNCPWTHPGLHNLVSLLCILGTSAQLASRERGGGCRSTLGLVERQGGGQ